ncbi:MAG: universal stress protein [Acidimicrobiia bacterium]|nr:universal stress protein [Acidimicrobiia bacterium]
MTVVRIVVGVDGSEESQHALRWAIDEARTRDGVVVEVVHAWTFPEPCRRATFNLPRSLAEQDAASVVGRSVRRARAETNLDVPIDANLVEGEPVAALLARAVGAELVVVGHTRRSRVGRWLHRRSVAREVADRAPCPVTVVTSGDGR